MRVGKKIKVVEAKRTRSCVVRLEKVPSPPSRIAKTVVTRNRSTPQQDEKKYKGPLKKRPISQTSPAVTASTVVGTAKAKEKEKEKEKQKEKEKPKQKLTKSIMPVTPVVETPPPTIAAGRSRRAIKPNPKYASDDMVTPKIIKNVAILGSSTNKKPNNSSERQRKFSSGSSEDFFNNESSDELGADDSDDANDKIFQMNYKDADSDFSDTELAVPTARPAKKRGRKPKSETANAAEKLRPQVDTPSASAANARTVSLKSTPSQLQQLRKTFATNMNTNRITMEGSAAKKRKLDTSTSDAKNNSVEITRKRFIMGSTNAKQQIVEKESKESSTNQSSTIATTPKQIQPSQTLNGSKITHVKEISTESKTIAADKRKQLNTDKMTPKLISKSTPNRTNANLAQTSTNKSVTAKLQLANSKQLRSSSPVAPKNVKSIENHVKKAADTSLSPTADDFETMPTFTIVNINDIINKKGDVLISKSGNKKGAPATSSSVPSPLSKTQKPVQESASVSSLGKNAPSAVETANSPAAASSKETTTRRKVGTANVLSERADPQRLPRTSLPPKKSTQTILNHTLLNKSKTPQAMNQRSNVLSGKVNATATNKPAPRILNSMVAKKTQPVKPMIANPDDSADESFPLSLDGEEEEAVNHEEEQDKQQNEEEADNGAADIGDEPFVGKRQKISANSTPFLSSKKNAPATKENSLAATNRLPAKLAASQQQQQRKMSPEKVVISRQGDKIIKKITCFETWYVINFPEDRPVKLERNQLEMPLIKLANVANDINLPSDSWSSKVTLYEVSAGMLAKSNLTTYIGDLKEHNVAEEDRAKYQPSCVMFRRKAINDRQKSRLPYDRAVIFKNKTFFTNIEGKNVKLVGAPASINTSTEVEILLHIVDSLTLQSGFVEPASTVQ